MISALEIIIIIAIIILVAYIIWTVTSNSSGFEIASIQHAGNTRVPALVTSDANFSEPLGRKNKDQFDQTSLTPDEAFDDALFMKNQRIMGNQEVNYPNTLTSYQKFVGSAK